MQFRVKTRQNLHSRFCKRRSRNGTDVWTKSKPLLNTIVATGKNTATTIRKKIKPSRLFSILFPFLSRAKAIRVRLYRIFFCFLAMSIIVGILKPLPLTYAANPDLDTSVVTLLLKSGETVVEKDPLFEILDLQSYILLPLNKLATRMEITYDYQREQNTLLLKNAKTKRQVRIDLNKGLYLTDQETRWTEQTPLLFNSDFYLSPLLYEYLSAVKIDWYFQYQELVITGNWPIKNQTFGAAPMGSNTLPDVENLTYLEGPDCSFGTVRYEFNWEYRKDSLGYSTSEGSLSLRADGRAGAWAISLGGEVEYEENKEKNFNFNLIRAKYNDANKLIVFGDSDIYLEKTLQEQELRGILLMSSKNAFSRSLVPYTTITGPAEPGDKVVLYINGKSFTETVVIPGQDTYRFDNVPLKVKRLNIIKVIIEKPSGEHLITERTLASSLNVLDPGTHEWMTAGGYYRQDENEDWEKKLAVFKTKQTITNNLYLNSEIIRIQHKNYTNETQTIYGADNGIAFKLNQNTICSLDWLVGGTADQLTQGWSADALYCLEKGFIEGFIFYVDPTITENAEVNTTPGKGYQFLGELQLNDRTTYQAQIATTDPINAAQMGDYTSRYTELIRHYKHGDQLQNLFSVGASAESEVETDVKNTRTVNTKSLYAQQSIFNKGSSSRNYLAGEWETDGELSRSVEYELDYIKLYGKAALYNLSIEAVESNGYKDYTQLKLDSSFKWFNRKRSASIYGNTDFYGTNAAADSSFTLEAAILGFWHKYYWNDEWSLYTDYEWNYSNDDNYTSTTINLTRQLPKRAGKYYAEFSSVSPWDSRTTPQYAYKIGMEYRTKNGLEIKLEAAKIYESLVSNNAERVYSLTCGQAIGFSGRRYKKILANSDNLSIVSGVVYLDENGNRQWDRDEKVLPNVRMLLNGRQATTTAKGEYLYQYVEPDSYKLYFDLRSLAADYTPINDAILFKLKENENMFFDFGVTLNGSISGRLFIDQNNNRLYDETDQTLDWVAVIIDNGRQKVFTDKDGIFYFENVSLGEHTIEVLSDSLPKNLEIVGKTSFARLIKENVLDVKDIEIPVIYKFEQ
jgi:hypothetical protein